MHDFYFASVEYIYLTHKTLPLFIVKFYMFCILWDNSRLLVLELLALCSRTLRGVDPFDPTACVVLVPERSATPLEYLCDQNSIHGDIFMSGNVQ